MSPISSAQNPRLRAVRRLHSRRGRERSGAFLAEGEDLILAAHAAGREPLEGYRAAGASLEPAAARDAGAPLEPAGALSLAGFEEVEPAALARVSTLGSGTRVLAVYPQLWGEAAGPLCVYLHGVADPGNVGTIVRAAHAFGASCVALGPSCADPHSPKAVRASMGAIFAVALARVDDLGGLPGELVALDAAGEQTLPALAADLAAAERAPAEVPSGERGGGITLLVGAEREGLPQELLERCTHRARIDIAGDSLNAAMAATVALYEITRRPSRVRPA